MVKIFIQRKIKPGKEEEFKQLVRGLYTRAIHTEGFISGETMQSIEDPAVHVTIGTWKSITNWNDWYNSPERKEAQEKLSQILAEPTKITSFHYV